MYEIRKAAVIGAGTMGLGIAGQLANAGVDVILLDVPADGDNRNAHGERAIERLLDENQPGLTHRDNLVRITIGNIEDDLGKLSDVDWIAEAIVERLDLKKNLYKQIDAVRKSGSIVSSNTSTIPIALLVEDMPDDFQAEFAITHFFNPKALSFVTTRPAFWATGLAYSPYKPLCTKPLNWAWNLKKLTRYLDGRWAFRRPVYSAFTT